MVFNTFISTLKDVVNSESNNENFISNIRDMNINFSDWFKIYSAWNEFDTEMTSEYYPEEEL